MEEKSVKTDPQCQHTCKGFCTALEIATLREKETILQYDSLRDECSYPDVKVLLTELILQRQKSIRLLEDVKALLRSKFEVLEQIQSGFED